jgi:hypothetical protein
MAMLPFEYKRKAEDCPEVVEWAIVTQPELLLLRRGCREWVCTGLSRIDRISKTAHVH